MAPKRTKAISIRFRGDDCKHYDRLKKLAKQQRRSVSSLVVEIVERHLKNRSK